MEYLTELLCPAEGLKLPAYNLVVLCATFGDTDWEIPVAIKLGTYFMLLETAFFQKSGNEA